MATVLPASGKLTSALLDAERTNTSLTRLAGRDLTDQATSWTLDRSYDTDLPAPMRVVNGSAAAELRLTLTGKDDKTGAQLYSPYAPHDTGDVARPGQSVTHGWGLTGEVLPGFRGQVRDRAADNGTGTVAVSALDGAEKLRDAARLPAVLSANGNPIASGTWVVDHLLREGGIHSAPPPRADCTLYASMHGGVVPDIGFYRDHTPNSLTYRRDRAPWEMAAVPGSQPFTVRWDPRTPTTVSGRGLFTEFWVDRTTLQASGNRVELKMVFQADNEINDIYYWFDFKDDQMNIGATGTGGTVKGDAAMDIRFDGLYHIGVHWTWNGRTPSARYYITGSAFNTYRETDMGAFRELGWSQLNYMELTSALPIEAVQVSLRENRMTREEFTQTWTRGAVLDQVTSELRAIPPVQSSAWDVITSVAQAEQATAEFDPYGVFRYRNNTRFTTPGQTIIKVTSAREIASLRVSEAIDSIRNTIDVPYQTYTPGTPSERFTETFVPSLLGFQTRTFTYDYDVSEYDSPPTVVYASNQPTTGSRVRFATSTGSGSGAVNGFVESTTERDGATLRMTFRNLTSSTLYLSTASGTPSLVIWSPRLASGSPTRLSTQRYDITSRTRYGAQVYQVPATPWIQNVNTAGRIANYLLSVAAQPLPVLGDVEILPDPRITLGDLVRVVDEVGAALDTSAWVIGIRTSGDGTGRIRQFLTLRATTSPGVPADTGLNPDPAVDPDARAQLAREGVRVP
ncbi:hypothetical protein [Lentzea flava]|uniref:Minor tail protein n=1 Tax=Lentzea flava TaxID=103732 RepID=A0ABQ2UQI9_9PSEU|nr:hypothetical protein [Lentzea flava]MCP2200953.1 hypothetical protein [Lentzea flava]GGU46853.1 hypothetical protein GCM10010178_44110 [Lentzea flava]